MRQPLTRNSFFKIFKKYVALVALPDTITPHSARATFITQAYEAGMQGEDIQRTVGHSSITTTEGYNQSAKKLRKSASLGMRY
ncbi:tyrosine-type recombinase/integrase [Paramylibacter ulvae]|uniref:tyrosine-type recombinase/integrase n=1 Tax=Paramylibacter ulvae TaxID=1651968 RepID=UPI00167499F3